MSGVPMECKERALSLPERAKNVTVTSPEECLFAEEMLAECRAMELEIHAAFDPIVERAFAAHKSAVAQLKKYIEPIEAGRKAIKGKIAAYRNEAERARLQAQMQAQAEARRIAEERALAEAIQAEADGDIATANAIMEEPVYVPPVIVQRTAPPATRLSAERSTWRAEEVDLMELIRAVASGSQPASLLMGNMIAINARARTDKHRFCLPGFRAVEMRA